MSIDRHDWEVYTSCLSSQVLFDDYKKGKKLTWRLFAAYLCVFVSFMEMITSQLLYLRGSSYTTLFILSSLKRQNKYKNETMGLNIIIIEDCWIHEDSFVISNRGRLLGYIQSCICDLIQQNYICFNEDNWRTKYAQWRFYKLVELYLLKISEDIVLLVG